MKKTSLLILSFVVVAALAYVSYVKRLQIAAKAWHWRHGNTVLVNGYQVPVPEGWFVTNQTEEDLDVELVTTGASVSVMSNRPRSSRSRDLSYWKLNQEQLLEGKGFKDINERTLHFDGETVVCVGGLVILPCISTTPLHFMYVGQESKESQFEAVISGIHKH
jgi:hypothetical protein